MRLRKTIGLTFIVVMTWVFWKHLRFGVEILKVSRVTDGMSLLDFQGITIVSLFKQFLDAPKTIFGFGLALLQSISIPSLALLVVWIKTLRNTKYWNIFVFVLMVYLLLNGGIVCLFAWLMTFTNPSQALGLAHGAGWLMIAVSAVMMLMGIVACVAVLGDTVAIDE